MPLESIPRLLAGCRAGGYAVGYFESWNLESLQGVLDAAEQTRSPVIVGFNGEFLSGRERLAPERLALYGALGRAAAEASSVPCGFIFNECPDDSWVLAAVESGFNLVMPADPSCSYDEYVRRVKRIVARAHARQVAVEAELGKLPWGAAGAGGHPAQFTDPEVAARFVDETGVDLLAVSVGNVHVQMAGETDLDLDRLAAIGSRVRVPLVLHGGTGIAPQALPAAIRLGVAKVNYGTYLKQASLKAVRSAVSREVRDPHDILGRGGPRDVLVASRLAVRDAVLERIGLLGCCGRAS
jgi:ketose-bisphosphate aldolase